MFSIFKMASINWCALLLTLGLLDVSEAVGDQQAKKSTKDPVNTWNSECIKVQFTNLAVKIYQDDRQMADTNLDDVKPSVTDECSSNPSSITALHKIGNYSGTIKMIISNNGKSWSLDKTTLEFQEGQLNGNNDLKIVGPVKAKKGHSYRCVNPDKFKSAKNTGVHARIDAKGFQIQGMLDGKDKPFGPAEDCFGLFTMPILIGLISSIFLALIVIMAIGAMAGISTPDRFDDPKGPQISVPKD